MLPLLPFVAGLVTGATALKLWRSNSSRLKLDKAQDSLRQATVSSLEAIEQSSASMRQRLSQPAAELKPARKPVARKRSTKATTQPKEKVVA